MEDMMNKSDREKIARQWGISPHLVKLPSEMTADELKSVAWEYGDYWTKRNAHAYGFREDGTCIGGRRIEVERIGML